MGEFLKDYWGWLFGTSLAMFVGTLIAMPWLLVRMPADYFVREERPPSPKGWTAVRLLGKSLKNLAGAAFVLAGLAMLVLPGQGILTLLIGLSLLNFPGKRCLELKLIRRPRVLRSVNWLRRKAGKPPLIVDRDASEP